MSGRLCECDALRASILMTLREARVTSREVKQLSITIDIENIVIYAESICKGNSGIIEDPQKCA